MAGPGPGAGGYDVMDPEGDILNEFFFPGAPARPTIPVVTHTGNFPVGGPFDAYGFVGPLAAGIGLPGVGVFGGPDEAPASGGEASANEVIDEFEDQFPQTIFSPPLPPRPMSDEDWDRVYDEYVILNPESEVAIDWGDVFGGALGQIATGLGAPAMGFVQQTSPGGWAGPAPAAGPPAVAGPPTAVATAAGGCCPSPGGGAPRYGRYCYATGTVTPIRRKRRKALLTNGDFNDLMRIASLPNKETVKIALASAIR